MNENKTMSGWLIASDIDGTINNKLRRMPDKNYDAIMNFIENGGTFTLASGRNPQSMEPHFRKLHLKGVPAIVINGAGIYDFDKNEMIYFKPMSDEAMRIAVNTAKMFPLVDALIIAKDTIYVTGSGWFGKRFVAFDNLDHICIKNIDEVPKQNWGKVIFSGAPSQIKKVIKHFQSLNDPDITVVSSSVASVEILEKDTTKGTALKEVARMLDIDMEKVGAIGDYFNDYDMLKCAGISACCGQAPKEMKEISEYVTCHCNKGAVADFIGYITKKAENNY